MTYRKEAPEPKKPEPIRYTWRESLVLFRVWLDAPPSKTMGNVINVVAPTIVAMTFVVALFGFVSLVVESLPFSRHFEEHFHHAEQAACVDRCYPHAAVENSSHGCFCDVTSRSAETLSAGEGVGDG